MTVHDMTIFDFEEQAVRTVLRDGEPWFVATDVCRVLGIENASDALKRLDEDEVTLDSIEGNHRQINLISESGLYAFIIRSDKPAAKRFRKWVTAEVLPALRRSGRYDIADAAEPPRGPAVPDMARQDVSNWLSMVREARLLRGPAAAIRLWDRSPLPPLDAGEPVVFAAENALSAFLAECCEVTGQAHDRIGGAALYAAFGDWARDTGRPPMSATSFYRGLRQMAGRWRCPGTGQRFSAIKRSVSTYCGLRLLA